MIPGRLIKKLYFKSNTYNIKFIPIRDTVLNFKVWIRKWVPNYKLDILSKFVYFYPDIVLSGQQSELYSYQQLYYSCMI